MKEPCVGNMRHEVAQIGPGWVQRKTMCGVPLLDLIYQDVDNARTRCPECKEMHKHINDVHLANWGRRPHRRRGYVFNERICKRRACLG